MKKLKSIKDLFQSKTLQKERQWHLKGGVSGKGGCPPRDDDDDDDDDD